MDESVKIPEIDYLRIIYQEIINGISYAEDDGLYIKHLDESENVSLINKKREVFLKLHKEGLPTKEEKIKQLLESGAWTKEQEDKIEELKFHITDNEKNLKTIIPQQRPAIEKIIEDKKKELAKIVREKNELIGQTCDDFSEQESYNYLIYLSFFKDSELKERVFKSFSELDDLEQDEIFKHVKIFESVLSRFNEETLKKVAVLPMFLNVFTYARENVHIFFNKPLSKLTSFQMLLISLGCRNCDIKNNSEGEPPPLIGDTKIQDVVDWYDLQYSVLLGKRAGATGITKTVREVKN